MPCIAVSCRRLPQAAAREAELHSTCRIHAFDMLAVFILHIRQLAAWTLGDLIPSGLHLFDAIEDTAAGARARVRWLFALQAKCKTTLRVRTGDVLLIAIHSKAFQAFGTLYDFEAGFQ